VKTDLGDAVPKRTTPDSSRTAELLEKLLAVQLHGLGATQGQIAKMVGKQKLWVNQLLKGIPRKPTSNN
jgi:hypothetical protein